MNWLQKIIAQINRTNPEINLSENSSEAEVVDAMENVKVREVVEPTVDQSAKIEALEAKLVAFESKFNSIEGIDFAQLVTTESLETLVTEKLVEVNNSITAIKEDVKKDGLALQTTKTALTKEINSLKSGDSKKGSNPIEGPPPIEPEGDADGGDDDENFSFDMKDLVQGEVVSGIFS